MTGRLRKFSPRDRGGQHAQRFGGRGATLLFGRDARVNHAFVGPYTSIGNGCVVEHCEIENSIVLENSTIAHVDGRIEASLIGKNVKIGRTQRKPAAYRFMLGDNSEVGIT